nr:reverse transcriptase domain-containing protein [Tanacetum cinerariifolium]
WQRTVKEKITQSFEQGKEITFPPLTTSNRTEGLLVIEAKIGGHTIHRMYIDGDFMKRFKIETGRMKGALECMRISGFMHGINNPELTKRLNEHVPKTMEEIMIATTSFIRGEAAAASKKKGHVSWKPQDQSKRHADKRPDFRGHSRDGRGANRFTPSPRRQR